MVCILNSVNNNLKIRLKRYKSKTMKIYLKRKNLQTKGDKVVYLWGRGICLLLVHSILFITSLYPTLESRNITHREQKYRTVHKYRYNS